MGCERPSKFVVKLPTAVAPGNEKKNQMMLVYKLADVIKGFTFGQELNAVRGGEKKSEKMLNTFNVNMITYFLIYIFGEL